MRTLDDAMLAVIAGGIEGCTPDPTWQSDTTACGVESWLGELYQTFMDYYYSWTWC